MKSETSTKFYLIKCKPNDIQYWKPTRKYGRSQCKYGSMVLVSVLWWCSTEKIAFSLCACVLFLMLMWHQVLMKYKLEIEIHDLTIYSIVTKFKFFKLQALSYKHFLNFCRSVLIKHHLEQRNKIYDKEKNVIYFFNIKLLSLTLI